MARKPLGKAIRAQVLARDAYSCAMCGRRPPDVQLQVDHVVPVADGGTDIITNLAALCADCNRGKSSYHFGDYSSIRIVPPGLSAHFHYKSGVSELGDFTQCQLFCYYKNGIHGGVPDESFPPHSWQISGLDLHTSSDPGALELRRRHEEEQAYEREIRMILLRERSKLVVNEEGLCKLSGND